MIADIYVNLKSVFSGGIVMGIGEELFKAAVLFGGFVSIVFLVLLSFRIKWVSNREWYTKKRVVFIDKKNNCWVTRLVPKPVDLRSRKKFG